MRKRWQKYWPLFPRRTKKWSRKSEEGKWDMRHLEGQAGGHFQGLQKKIGIQKTAKFQLEKRTREYSD